MMAHMSQQQNTAELNNRCWSLWKCRGNKSQGGGGAGEGGSEKNIKKKKNKKSKAKSSVMSGFAVHSAEEGTLNVGDAVRD